MLQQFTQFRELLARFRRTRPPSRALTGKEIANRRRNALGLGLLRRRKSGNAAGEPK